MRTITGRECSIREVTFPGMLGEPLTRLEIVFEGDYPSIPLNNDTLSNFSQWDRESLVEYMNEIDEMNTHTSRLWAE